LRTLIPIDCGQHSDDRGQFPVDGFNGSLGVVRVKLAALAGFSVGLRSVSPSSANEAVEDGIRDRGITEHR
jgi:hypothetical protein